MAICPLCSERAGKRFCPAKDAQICAICCGTKREIEIDCPSSCAYLRSSRSYELDKPILEPELVAKIQRYDRHFIDRFQPYLDAANRAVAEERMATPWLVDLDVVEAFKALSATMKTLSSGIYYETLPDGPARAAVYRRLKALFDEMMQPDPSSARPVLKVSEVVDVLDFLTFTALINSSVRPKSRRFLDWLCETFGLPQPQQTGGLIIP